MAVCPVNTRVVVLTKEPIEGTVKTRLISSIGPKNATALHTALAWETIARAKESGLPVHVSLAGSMNSTFANELQTRGVSVEAQITGDLGQRLAHALRGPSKSIAIGTDCVVFDPIDPYSIAFHIVFANNVACKLEPFTKISNG